MEVTGVSTQAPDTQGSGRLTATIDGAPISAEISGLRFVPLQLSGRLIAKDVDATLAGIYLPAGVAAVLERARITAEVAARVDPKDGVRLDANGRLDDLSLRVAERAIPSSPCRPWPSPWPARASMPRSALRGSAASR